MVNRGDNYYNRRLLKITTVLASTLSGAMGLAYSQPGARMDPRGVPVATFDGRPLLLGGENDLLAYIRCRRLLHARNAMAKVLRLKSELSNERLYGDAPRLASDIHRLSRELELRSFWAHFERAASGCAMYVADADGELAGRTLPSDPGDCHAVRQAVDDACGRIHRC
ncbi:hypothetical protein ENSA5_39740 [Enhygromyxa salina]|uniref:Uncharacterized protein n=1 Tax=Enhygromyxa salina TaxID=215803 RepID=A0A2S9XRA0_9BACT|nr:hypothetical protein [Enhygromyxa salina]PRP95389.1 hypothetical protein ENSA5_39740 [Enhygromyxa salina]